MTDYNVMLDVGSTDPEKFDLEPFTPYGAVLVTTPARTRELVLTIPGKDISQAITTALAVFAAALHYEPYVVRAMSTAAYDAGVDLPPSPESVSVGEAAGRLGVTPSAVRQRLSAGRFPGERVGRDWQVPDGAVRATAQDTRIRWDQQPDGSFVGESPVGRYSVVRKGGGWVTRYPPGLGLLESGYDYTSEDAKAIAESDAVRRAQRQEP
ncbi:hypothetical protein [Cellulomonas sp. IC4_254]|uniref:hypothetical protein n=1 Tax=Cellulomonas sp. IC4_254 TaxID=2714040 RepID=UPI00142243B2|nr:hypothetical protein [Cellulomonas sp. IC4_254]NHT18737.1 hypothetical protein [Cellulomonas sp. IC4_254]